MDEPEEVEFDGQSNSCGCIGNDGGPCCFCANGSNGSSSLSTSSSGGRTEARRDELRTSGCLSGKSGAAIAKFEVARVAHGSGDSDRGACKGCEAAAESGRWIGLNFKVDISALSRRGDESGEAGSEEEK
jgi:hypothetical protein